MTHHKGVALPSEDLNGVDSEGLGVDSVCLNNCQVVTVDVEGVVRVTRDGNETEAVPMKSPVSLETGLPASYVTHRFPCVTLITARSAVTVLVDRPRPLMSVESEPNLYRALSYVALNVQKYDRGLTGSAGRASQLCGTSRTV